MLPDFIKERIYPCMLGKRDRTFIRAYKILEEETNIVNLVRDMRATRKILDDLVTPFKKNKVYQSLKKMKVDEQSGIYDYEYNTQHLEGSGW